MGAGTAGVWCSVCRGHVHWGAGGVSWPGLVGVQALGPSPKATTHISAGVQVRVIPFTCDPGTACETFPMNQSIECC